LCDLEKASGIEIECRDAQEQTPENQALRIVILSINSQTSGSKYLHYLDHLKAETLVKVREIVRQVDPNETDIFFEQLQARLKRLYLFFNLPENPTGGKPDHELVSWTPKFVRCLYDGKITHDPTILANVLHRTRKHALHYYRMLTKLEAKICYLSAASFLSPVTLSTPQPRSAPQKFRFNGSVPFLGAFMRVLCDRNLLENPNVAELCRRVADSISTSRQESLSPHSLRNSFDNPDPEVLSKLLEELKVCANYTEKLIERQRT
jgi:hypothetical protein